MTNFVKALDGILYVLGHDFTHLQQTFPHIIDTKLIREFIMDQK